MTTSTTGPAKISKTLAQRIALIDALDLEPIKFKARRQEDGHGWSAAYTERVALSYRRYLILCAKHPALTIAPDQDTDRFWHLHILDTRKYAADCEQVFGYFLHHFPYLGLRGGDDAQALDDAFAQTNRLALAEFGEPMLGSAAWCAAEQPATGAAWCAAEQPAVRAAWCAAEGPTAAGGKAAWCAAEHKTPAPVAAAAWCAAEALPAHAAWCAAAAAHPPAAS